jgi:hypothetical protein
MHYPRLLLVLFLTALTGVSAISFAESPPSASPAEIKGQIQTLAAPLQATVNPAQVPTTPESYFHTGFVEMPIENGDISSKYKAYRVEIKNMQPYHLQVVMGEVLNGVDEAIAANQALESSNKRKRGFGALMRGLSAVPVLGAYGHGYGSYGAYQAAAIASNTVGVAASIAENSQSGAATISGRYTRNFRDVVINPNETYSIVTLVPKEANPQIKVVFRNLETNQILDFHQY